MARAQTLTWLPLDRWFEILGVDPLHANGLDSNTIKPEHVCGDAWMQFAWQHADQVSREDLAFAIREAETKIAGEVGYNLLPDWREDERHQTARPTDPVLYSDGRNARGQAKSIETDWGYVITGGRKAKSVIEAGVAVVRTDEDGDTYKETVTLTVTTTVTSPDEIRVFYPGESGADNWEIRPIKVSIASGVATITFKSWQIVDPALQERINAIALDAETDANYMTIVDVYRVYNDPSVQVEFLWEQPYCASCGGSGCASCVQGSQNGCLMVRDGRLGIAAYRPGDWDADDEEFDAVAYSTPRDPDRMRIWYYSGWRGPGVTRPYTALDPYWEQAIAYYAASLLDRPTCGCSNVTEFVKRMRRDHALVSEDGSYQLTPSQMDNNFGTTAGALYAFRRTREPMRRIGK